MIKEKKAKSQTADVWRWRWRWFDVLKTVLPILQNNLFFYIITAEGGAIKYMGITAGERGSYT